MTQTTNQFHEQDDLNQKRIIDICALALYGNIKPITRAAIHNALDVDDLLYIDHCYLLMRHLLLGGMLERENIIDDLILFDWFINHNPRVVSIPNAGWVVAKDNSILIQEKQRYDDDIPF